MPPIFISKGESMKHIIIATGVTLFATATAIGGYVGISKGIEALNELKQSYIEDSVRTQLKTIYLTMDTKKKIAISDAPRDDLLKLIYLTDLKIKELESRIDIASNTLTEQSKWE